ncbi:hypothetical protein ZOSMA_7390G00010, partial [Zostera marina]
NIRSMARILLTKKSRRTRTFQEITGTNEHTEVLEANGSVLSILDWVKHAKLDSSQRRAFEVFTATFILTFHNDFDMSDTLNMDPTQTEAIKKEGEKLRLLSDVDSRGKQLICLLHGPGGSGKTTVVDLFIMYCREFSDYIPNFIFTPRTIVITAMSGVAATLLMGETTHKALHLNTKRNLNPEDIELWTETRMVIIDEISFASADDFKNMNNKLCVLKQKIYHRYGDLHIIFSGDFRQLEPCGREGKKAVYYENCPQFKNWTNCFIELTGMHRFKLDMYWGFLLKRFRSGEVTQDDIDFINKRLVRNGKVVTDGTYIPEDLKYATYFNRDRDAINTALFEKRCQEIYSLTGHQPNDTIMILADELEVKNGDKTYRPFRNNQLFWENCGEDDCKPPRNRGRVDPVLKLFKGCLVMLTVNKCVLQGEANGTQAEVIKVRLKHGVIPKTVLLNETIPVAAVKASEVEELVLKHLNDRIQPSEFTVKTSKYTFNAKIP